MVEVINIFVDKEAKSMPQGVRGYPTLAFPVV